MKPLNVSGRQSHRCGDFIPRQTVDVTQEQHKPIVLFFETVDRRDDFRLRPDEPICQSAYQIGQGFEFILARIRNGLRDRGCSLFCVLVGLPKTVDLCIYPERLVQPF